MKKFFAAIISALILTTAVAFAGGPPQYDTPYIGNTLRGTFHYRDCASIWEMWVEHQYPLNSVEEAYQKGFRPCKNCRPDIPRP